MELDGYVYALVLYPLGETPTNIEGWRQSRPEFCGQEINLQYLPGYDPRFFGSSFQSLDTVVAELPRIFVCIVMTVN
jgi:hypothetical protein